MAFKCPECSGKTDCLDSRHVEDTTRRRFSCRDCGHRFTTCEFLVRDATRALPIKSQALKNLRAPVVDLMNEFSDRLKTMNKG